jgi:hypothetical protein
MKNSLYFVLSVLLCGLSRQADAVAGMAPQLLSIEARLTSTPNGPGLKFTVKNVSNHTVTIEEPRLPWGQRYSVMIVAAERKSGSPLKEVPLIDDAFLSPKVSIKPGQSLSGSIELVYYVADIDKKLRSTDLVLFWYYDARGNNETLGEYGGWILIPKGTK